MTLAVILSAALYAFVMAMTPGPNNMMLAASGANFGLRRTVPHIIGIILGFPLMVGMIGLGAGQVFAALPWLYPVLKAIGFGWLLWLAWRISQAGPPGADGKPARARPMYLIEAAGFQWINPKAWMMAVSFIALFTVPGADYRWQVALLVAVVAICAAISTVSWAAIGVVIARLLERAPRLLRAVNIGLALLMVASVLPGLFQPAPAITPSANAAVASPFATLPDGRDISPIDGDAGGSPLAIPSAGAQSSP